MPTTIVLISEANSVFVSPLLKQYTTIITRSGKQGIEAVTQHNADVIVLDAISLRTHGDRICKSVRAAFPEKVIIHIRPEPATAQQAAADVILTLPLPPRMLINTIEHFTTRSHAVILKCGHFEMDIERRILVANGTEHPLTPKQAELIEIFLRHPNEVLDRKWLMQRVWNTSYIGDTRTLSVHIRFVREVMEKNPSKPRYLKTIRGVGYQLDMPDR